MNKPNEQITTVQWDTRLNTIAVIGAWATLLLLILFGTTNSAQAQIELDVSGNIGIGTASPNATYRLRVSGDNAYAIRATGNNYGVYGAAVNSNTSMYGIYGYSRAHSGGGVTSI